MDECLFTTKMVMDTFCFRIFAAVLHRLLHKNREVKMNKLTPFKANWH